ncbi:receptor-like protein 7 [Corylus avellana]|uniref:receptor-like protein 7 n=1 Tax=Corylus avellana TaxID=13451 RepID=UPI00286BF354|nr:receptor-like protein 7 [Corylus avellana]
MALFSLTDHSSPPMCHGDDSSALLQFKQSFFTPVYDFDNLYNCQFKPASWTLELNKSDCCSWDGVECDDNTGRVIGLDLSSSCLFGSISSSSSLFRLVHLQRLNLAYNYFNYSSIPPQVRNLSRLTHLNLAFSNFSGEIPLEISQLSQLSYLDLSSDYSLLELKKAGLRTLVGNLTHLQELDLSRVHINSTVPNTLANLSSLTFLSLCSCGLHGEFPIGIFKLSNLRVLDVGENAGLTGYLPNYKWSSPLQKLYLTSMSFSGELPASMGNLSFLTDLSIRYCNFSGSIPSSLGNLTKLTVLLLSNNSFVGNIPHSLGNLFQLSQLDLSWTQLTGQVPFRLLNLPQLSYLDLSYNLLSGEIKFENETRLTVIGLNNNRLTGPITFGPMNLTNLRVLDLACNKFRGQISNSIFSFKNLEVLFLFENYFNGTLEFDEFLKLKHLYALDISGNQLSLLIEETSANATLQFEDLGFSSCNLSEVPNFIRSQHELKHLNLSNNKIHGQVPEWMWNTSTRSLEVLDLSNNLLGGFSQHQIIFPWTSLQFLDLRSNLLQGSLPTPPISTLHFYISSNSLTGNVSELFCNLSSLQVLDLANNNLSGSLPRCFDNFAESLLVLDLRRNKFQGSIPETWINGSQLRIINFSQNKFQGQLPRLLAECTMLKVIDLSDNQFNDTFPFWLGHLSNLKVLRLRSNKFNGRMETPQTYFYKFPNIRILDISYNDFMGKLPLRLFENWKAKKLADEHMLTYIHENSDFEIRNSIWYAYTAQPYTYSMVMTNKGNDVFYEKVQEVFIAIDFSSNRFVGEIPESIGNLKGAQLLNLSNNALTGHIPSSLENLTELEALDLSQNKLSGEIPQQLIQLTFLEFLNVSHNILTGSIPQGRQFDTFENSSFEGNLRLCGRPLTKKCKNSNEQPSQPSISQESQDSGSTFEFGWKIVAIGYGFGFVVRVIIGRIVIERKHDWLMKTLRIRPLGGKRRRN